MTKKPQMIQKEEQVTQLEAWLKENTAVVLADYRGLTVAEDTALRSELRKNDIGYHVAKNTLIKRAANNLEITALDEYLNGPTALAYAVLLGRFLGSFISSLYGFLRAVDSIREKKENGEPLVAAAPAEVNAEAPAAE